MDGDPAFGTKNQLYAVCAYRTATRNACIVCLPRNAGHKSCGQSCKMQKQMTESRAEARIPAFVEPVSSCPGEISELAQSVAQSYGIPLTTLNDYSGDKEQVVLVLMNSAKQPEFMQRLVDDKGQGVKALFVEQFSHKLPEKFEEVFEKDEINLSDHGSLPTGIERDELAPELDMKFMKLFKEKNKENTKEYVSQLLQVKLKEKKPKKRTLTIARKYLLQEKLRQYGNLEDVLKALAE